MRLVVEGNLEFVWVMQTSFYIVQLTTKHTNIKIKSGDVRIRDTARDFDNNGCA